MSPKTTESTRSEVVPPNEVVGTTEGDHSVGKPPSPYRRKPVGIPAFVVGVAVLGGMGLIMTGNVAAATVGGILILGGLIVPFARLESGSRTDAAARRTHDRADNGLSGNADEQRFDRARVGDLERRVERLEGAVADSFRQRERERGGV